MLSSFAFSLVLLGLVDIIFNHSELVIYGICTSSLVVKEWTSTLALIFGITIYATIDRLHDVSSQQLPDDGSAHIGQ